MNPIPAKILATIRQRAARIKLFLCDVDGVLTDGSIWFGERSRPGCGSPRLAANVCGVANRKNWNLSAVNIGDEASPIAPQGGRAPQF